MPIEQESFAEKKRSEDGYITTMIRMKLRRAKLSIHL